MAEQEYLVKGSTLTGVANAIRSKAGITGTFPLNEFASKIESISAGASVLSGTFKPTSSAIQTITHNLGKTPIRNPNLLSDWCNNTFKWIILCFWYY